MTPIAKFISLAAFAAGVSAVAVSSEQAQTVDTDPATLYASPLVARADKISCRTGHGWDEDIQGELEHFIADFADTYDGTTLDRGAESSEWYTASNDAKFYLSVSNRACDHVKIEDAVDILTRAVHACRVEGSNHYSGGAVDYEVTPDTPNGCGHYMIYYASSDSTADIVRPAKRDLNCATCPQHCLNHPTTCSPPEWSRCTQQEKDCILGSANSFYSCLIAGSCARDEAKEKRCPSCVYGPCPRCTEECLQPDTTCNPPVWSLCTPTEKSCLLEFAADEYGCLLAGNCLPEGISVGMPGQFNETAPPCTTCNITVTPHEEGDGGEGAVLTA